MKVALPALGRTAPDASDTGPNGQQERETMAAPRVGRTRLGHCGPGQVIRSARGDDLLWDATRDGAREGSTAPQTSSFGDACKRSAAVVVALSDIDATPFIWSSSNTVPSALYGSSVNRSFRLTSVVRLAGALLVPTWAGSGMADVEAPVALDWRSPGGECPSTEHMLEAIARTVGKGAPAAQPLNVKARVFADSSGQWAAQVELFDSEEKVERQVAGESCAAVSDAVVMIIALAVAPTEEELPEPVARAEPQPPLPDMSPSPPALTGSVTPSTWTPVVRASAVFDVGTLASSAFGAEVHAGVIHKLVEIVIVGAALQSSSRTLPSRPSEGANFSMLHLGAQACYRFVKDSIHFGPCAGAGEEWTLAHGFGSVSPSDANGETLVVSGGGYATARLSPNFGVNIDAAAVVLFARPTYVIDGGGTVFQQSVAAFRVSAGVELLF